MWLQAIEIDVKFLQYSNGSWTICSIALLSKLMAINVGINFDFDALHSKLKKRTNIYLMMKT